MPRATRFSFERSWPTLEARPSLKTSGFGEFPVVNEMVDRGQSGLRDRCLFHVRGLGRRRGRVQVSPRQFVRFPTNLEALQSLHQ